MKDVTDSGSTTSEKTKLLKLVKKKKSSHYELFHGNLYSNIFFYYIML